MRYQERLLTRLCEAEALLYGPDTEVGRANSGAEQGDEVSVDAEGHDLGHDSSSSSDEGVSDFGPHLQQLQVAPSMNDFAGLDLDNTIRINAMAPKQELTNKKEVIAAWLYDANINCNLTDSEQPKCNAEDCRVMVVMLTINGQQLYTLLDSGSTTSAISPEAVISSAVEVIELKQPMTLQLGMIGSKGRINHGVNTHVGLGSVSLPVYFDIANIDYYDVIIGTLFLNRNKVILDFSRFVATIIGIDYECLSLEREHLVCKHVKTQCTACCIAHPRHDRADGPDFSMLPKNIAPKHRNPTALRAQKTVQFSETD